jgi:hypothetical protein
MKRIVFLPDGNNFTRNITLPQYRVLLDVCLPLLNEDAAAIAAFKNRVFVAPTFSVVLDFVDAMFPGQFEFMNDPRETP